MQQQKSVRDKVFYKATVDKAWLPVHNTSLHMQWNLSLSNRTGSFILGNTNLKLYTVLVTIYYTMQY